MANIKMKTLTVGEDVFEIVDEQAREAIEELQENGVKTSVESVNGKTGVVTLKASDVGALSASDIVDELTSTESNKALSARLGFQLNSKLTTLRNEFNNLEGDGTIEVDMEEGTFSHKDSGVAANWYGEQGGGDLSFGGSFTVPGALNIDAKGHITEARDNQFKLPDNEATETKKGLLSATDKAKLNKLKPPFNFELNNNSASNVDVNVTLFDADEEAVAEFGVVGKGLAKVSRNSTSGALEINVKKETVDLSGYATTQQLATVEGKIPTVAQEKGWDDNSVMSQSAVTFELRNLDNARIDHEEWLIRHGDEIGGLSEEIANLSIPTKVSQLTNDSHFVTSEVTDGLASEIVQLREDLTAEPLEEVDTVIRYAADGADGTIMPEFAGWYINAEGVLADAANTYQYLTKAIPILPNTVITYKLLYLTSQQVMAFYDENGDYISGVSGTTNNETIEGVAEIPENAKMVIFNFRYSFTGLYAQVKYTTEGTPTITEQTITSSAGSGDIKTSGQKSYSSTDGSFTATSAYEYVDKMALDADVISVTCFGKGASSVGLAVFFDKNNEFLSACVINSSSRTIKAIHAPEGAVYVGFTHLAGDTKAIYHMTTIKYEERSGGSGSDDSINHWLGKKWYAFGTSITDTSYTNAETGSVTGKYVPYLVSESGMIVTNYGKAGGCIASGGVHGGSADILTRILATDVSDADLITLEGFVNDFACAITIGDVGDTEQTTLCGALYQAINYFQQNSNAVVALITEHTGRKYTLTSTGGEADYTINKKNSVDKFQSDYNEAIRKMARHMGCYLIDAGAESQINENHPEYLIDHLHHTELGGQQYAKVIWSHLKDIPCMVTE